MPPTSHIQRFALPVGSMATITGRARSVSVTVKTSNEVEEVVCELRSRRLSAEQMAERVTISQQESVIHFEVNPLRTSPLAMHFSIEFTVPVGAELDIQSSSGSISVFGTLGNVRAQASSGSVSLEGECLDAELRTTSGSIGVDRATQLFAESTSGSIRIGDGGPTKAHASSGSVNVRSVVGTYDIGSTSGSIKVGRVDGQGAINSVSGSIVVGSVSGGLKAEASSGSIRIASLFQGALTAQTRSGSVAIGVAPGTAVLVDAQAGSGVVHSDLQGTDPAAHERTAGIVAKTSSGSIRLSRADS